MQQSSPEIPKPVEPKSILLLGPPGGGKTTLGMQFPSVLIMDCERNLDGPERFLRTVNKSLSYWYESITIDEKKNPIPVEKCFDNLMLKMDEAAKHLPSRTVLIDNLTFINEFIIRKILAEQRKTEMEVRHWQPFKSHLLSLLMGKVRNLGKTVIVTAHEVVNEKPTAQPMVNVVDSRKPAVQGGIIDYFGGFFTDVWRCDGKPGGGMKMDYTVQFQRDAQSDLKNTMGLPFNITVREGELLWPKLEPYMKGVV